MHVALFKALQSIKVSDDTATDVVDKLDGHIAMKISEANKGLETKLDSVKQQMTWVMFLVAAFGLANFTSPLWLPLLKS
jgi:hypothetical protein